MNIMLPYILSKLGYSKSSILIEKQIQNKTLKNELIDSRSQRDYYERKFNRLTVKFQTKADDFVELKNKINNNSPVYSRNQIQNWSKKVRKTGHCHCCGYMIEAQELQAHHLWSKSLHPTLAIEVTNGVALCDDCHQGYHRKYPNIENCSPYTYSEYKTDFNNKQRLVRIEKELAGTLKNKILKLIKGKV